MNSWQPSISYPKNQIISLNKDIKENFPHIFPIEENFCKSISAISRLVMLDRYSQKDKSLATIKIGDLVVCVVKEDSKFPSRGIGSIVAIDENSKLITIKLEDEYYNGVAEHEKNDNKTVKRSFGQVEKPLEIYWEQIAKRVANNLASMEDIKDKDFYFKKFFYELSNFNFIPAGRVLYGAGSDSKVTYFNCFVLPFIADSRTGISDHRKQVMEIMSRGGGVGTNGSTLRPKNAIAKSVGGKSSGAVSWLNDIANLTHLVEQGGSRRGAQMIMMADWHPDIVEFIISKMQRPDILVWLKNNSPDAHIREEASKKIAFEPFKKENMEIYEEIIKNKELFSEHVVNKAMNDYHAKGKWVVQKLDFLTGANISVTISHAFMKAVEKDEMWMLKFPAVESYSPKDKEYYDNEWNQCGNIEEWEKQGYKVRTYRKIKARALWDLINFCSTYSAEPGVFFIDSANDLTNAQTYGQKVVATNPCGEQPLAPYSVCNLGAINLSNFVDHDTHKINYEKLQETTKMALRMLDNVIDSTPYFLKANEEQAKGERRIGLGIMGLHDLLIWNRKKYGSKEGNEVTEKVIKTIATTAYLESTEIARQKGSFPFLRKNSDFLESGYMKKMPKEVKEAVLKYGIRNSHILTIAPTGSTGTLVGVSTGLEPYFAFQFFRSGRLGKFIKVNADIVSEFIQKNPKYNENNLPDYFVSSMELTPEEHAWVQIIIQKWVDSSISKTVNAPKGFTVRQVEKIYNLLYKNGAKGGTIYVDGSRDSQVLSLTAEENDLSDKDANTKVKAAENSKPIEEAVTRIKEIVKTKEGELRGERQDRNIGVDVGNLCPICREGLVKEIGGCNTCTNCSAQLKCGL